MATWISVGSESNFRGLLGCEKLLLGKECGFAFGIDGIEQWIGSDQRVIAEVAGAWRPSETLFIVDSIVHKRASGQVLS